MVYAIVLDFLQRGEQHGPSDGGLRYAVVKLAIVGALLDAAGEFFAEELLQPLGVIEIAAIITAHLYRQHVVFAELALQVLQTANALEPATDHEAETSAQRFAVVHAAGKTSW